MELYVTSLFSPILFLLFIVYILISIFVFLMFSFFFFFFLFQLTQIFLNNNELLEWIPTLFQPRSLSQCSMELEHLIRTSPIGTWGVSLACMAVRNISLFTILLFCLLIYFYIHLCFANFLILLSFFYNLNKSPSTKMNCSNGYKLFPNSVHCHSVLWSFSI